MDIQGKTVLVLGGWGLVGTAVCRLLLEENPKALVVTSLKREEAEDAAAKLRELAPAGVAIRSAWGNLFVREELKGASRQEILESAENRTQVYRDNMDELSEELLQSSTLFRIIQEHRPEIVIDCVNTATGISYQDVYDSFRRVRRMLADDGVAEFRDETEKLLCTLYIPQLIRHVQIAYEAMRRVKTQIYVKVGTSGTGGMGLNIPYTHSEEKPSRVLLSKSAIAGAHSLLLFLMGRTPDAPITKEIKPAAAIAWKEIGFGPIRRRGRPIELFDCGADGGTPLGEKFRIRMSAEECGAERFPQGEPEALQSVYVDTGENGIFSRGEFSAITAAGQMEFVTPEEIARNIVFEIKGGNTGHDIINALDNAAMSPTYRAGYLRGAVVERMQELEREHGVTSVAFENLGPPRLSKLLYEAFLLERICGTMDGVLARSAEELAAAAWQEVRDNQRLRAEIISIGIPILVPTGDRLLRAPEVKIPPHRGDDEVALDDAAMESWAEAGWVDLRPRNWERWRTRVQAMVDECERTAADESSSRVFIRRHINSRTDPIRIGTLAAWIFGEEEKGARMKD